MRLRSSITNELMGLLDNPTEFYSGFSMIPVSNEILLTDPLLNQLYLQVPFRAGILCLEANTFYDWHTDTDRKCALNMLISGNGLALYRYPLADPRSYFTVQIPYVLGEYLPVDTSRVHGVWSGTTARSLLSMDFGSDLTYDDLCAILMKITESNKYGEE